jgi:hypothetical protein
MKQVILTVPIICLIACSTAFSKTPPLLPASKRVQVAYVAWKKHPTLATQQKKFLAAFPKTKAGFIAVFHPDDFSQLYSTSWTYISALEKVGIAYPTPVMHYCLTISKTHPVGSDAITILHEVTMNLALAHPQVFISEVKMLPVRERYELFHFLADVEGIGDYPDYEKLVQEVNKNDATGYAAELRKAKQWRLRQPNE